MPRAGTHFDDNKGRRIAERQPAFFHLSADHGSEYRMQMRAGVEIAPATDRHDIALVVAQSRRIERRLHELLEIDRPAPADLVDQPVAQNAHDGMASIRSSACLARMRMSSGTVMTLSMFFSTRRTLFRVIFFMFGQIMSLRSG